MALNPNNDKSEREIVQSSRSRDQLQGSLLVGEPDEPFGRLRWGLSYVIAGCQIALQSFVEAESRRLQEIAHSGKELAVAEGLRDLALLMTDPVESFVLLKERRAKLIYFARALEKLAMHPEYSDLSKQAGVNSDKVDVAQFDVKGAPTIEPFLTKVAAATRAWLRVGDFIRAIEGSRNVNEKPVLNHSGSVRLVKLLSELEVLSESIPAIKQILNACEPELRRLTSV